MGICNSTEYVIQSPNLMHPEIVKNIRKQFDDCYLNKEKQTKPLIKHL